MDDSKMDVMTCLFYSESTEGNSQWAGQYGLADGKCEGHSRAEIPTFVAWKSVVHLRTSLHWPLEFRQDLDTATTQKQR